jgi:Domain of unknown function (DUF4476)
MKTFFTLLSSLIMSVAVMAAGPKPKSTLSIRSTDQGNIRVIVDGKRFEPRHNSVMISNIDAGYHTVKIYRQRNTGLFNIIGKRYEVVYNTSVMMKPRTNILIAVDRFGRTTITEERIRGGYGRDWDHNRGQDDRTWNDNNDDDQFDFDQDGKWGDYDNRTDDDHSYDDRNHGGYDNSRTMNDREFSQVLSAMQKEWYEANKLKSAEQIVHTNYFTSAQVKLMLQLFSFENNKLELAKQAYAKTVDQRNFYLTVSDAFAFNSSKDELARYIRSFR